MSSRSGSRGHATAQHADLLLAEGDDVPRLRGVEVAGLDGQIERGPRAYMSRGHGTYAPMRRRTREMAEACGEVALRLR